MGDKQFNKSVFVYGTLMQGERAAHMLDGCTFAGKYLLKNYGMYHLGTFPGIKPCSGESVCGEVYFLTDEILKKLDWYEGEGSLYERTSVQVENTDGSIETEAYVYLGEVHSSVVRSPWNIREEDLVWYASYGSNLSSERFSYYIKGGEFCGKQYTGCKNQSFWKENLVLRVPGKMYFGNSSARWNYGGVAFFEASPDSETIMRMYKITWGQLLDIQKQEGSSPAWYGKQMCLGYFSDGFPIYTLTSEYKHEERKPSQQYVDLIYRALVEECHCTEEEAKAYLKETGGEA